MRKSRLLLLLIAAAGLIALVLTSPITARAAGGSMTASFTTSPANPVTGQAVTFDGSASVCSGGNGGNGTCTYKYTDLADGSVLGTSKVSTFTFHGSGYKYVALTITNAAGKTAAVEHDLWVGTGTHTLGSLAASFTVSPASPVTGSPVTFDGSASLCTITSGNGTCTYKYTDQADGSVLGTSKVSSFTFGGTGVKYVQLTVTSSNGKTASSEQDVTVSAPGQSAPTVTTSAASGVTSTGATLNGTVNPNGAAATWQYQYGTTTAYGSTAPATPGSAGSGTTAVSEPQSVTGLTASTTYHYRLTATNSGGTTNGPDQQFTTSAASGGLLTWSPPACGGADGLTCTTINLTNTGGPQNPSLASNVDYKIVLPSTPLTGGTLTISGGHNVQIIGGEIDLVNPCSDSGTFCPGQANGAIYITDGNAGEVYLEGVLIHNTNISGDTGATCPGGGMSCSTADGIDVNLGNGGNPASPPVIVMQDMRIDGISGCSGGSDHADVFQPYNAGSATVRIDHLTGTSNCQGMQIDPDFGFQSFGTLPNYDIRNVNMDVLNNPYSGNGNRYMWWLTYNTACNSGNINLSSDYAQEPNGTLNGNSVWPDVDQPLACKSVWSSPTLSFPSSPQITGVLKQGLPTGGDFVPVGVAGTSYVSPGYQ